VTVLLPHGVSGLVARFAVRDRGGKP